MCKAILLALALATPLLAQPARPATGRISGIVVIGDVPVPGVAVAIRYGSEVRTILTAADGRFLFDHVPLGVVVQLSSEMVGLKPQKRKVALTSAAASRDFTLAMKVPEETITVACAGLTPLDEPHTYHFTQADVDKLPIGRSIEAVLDLLPGSH